MIAALFVDTGGIYFGRDDVDPWDKPRDARAYVGPHAVVAHPPCERWGRYWYGGPVLHAQGKRKTKGDDGGCFAAALAAVCWYGGVLEHPADSTAWSTFGITAPERRRGWVSAGAVRASVRSGFALWTVRVEQGWFGHPSTKPTWLLAALPWRVLPPSLPARVAPPARNSDRKTQRLGVLRATGARKVPRSSAAATPPAFAELLISIAKLVDRGSVIAPS